MLETVLFNFLRRNMQEWEKKLLSGCGGKVVRCPQAAAKKKWNTGEKKETTVPVYKMEMFSPKKKTSK